jgi:hypothetical protein
MRCGLRRSAPVDRQAASAFRSDSGIDIIFQIRYSQQLSIAKSKLRLVALGEDVPRMFSTVGQRRQPGSGRRPPGMGPIREVDR